MAYTTCDYCGGDYEWNWVEAFEKFGFNDGDGQIETETVADEIRNNDYEVVTEEWGFHNTVIISIKRDGREIIADDQTKYSFGYDCPRIYLPQEIIDILDKSFPPTPYSEGND